MYFVIWNFSVEYRTIVQRQNDGLQNHRPRFESWWPCIDRLVNFFVRYNNLGERRGVIQAPKVILSRKNKILFSSTVVLLAIGGIILYQISRIIAFDRSGQSSIEGVVSRVSNDPNHQWVEIDPALLLSTVALDQSRPIDGWGHY